MPKKLVVIGGTAAGLSAASKVKRSNPEIEVYVYEKSGYVSYGACGLPYFVGDIIKNPENLVSLTVNDLTEKRNIKTCIHHEVIKINNQNKSIVVKNIDTDETFIQEYDYLVIATGATPIVPPIKGINSNGVYYLRTVEDGIQLKSKVINEAKEAVIVGGGFIGLEVAEELSFQGIKVTVIEAMPRLLPFLNEEFAQKVEKTLASNNVTVHMGVSVEEIIENNEKACGVKTSDGRVISADLILVSVGVKPNTKLAEDCNLKLGLKSSIVVDEYMQTSDSSIWACGDCVQMFQLTTQEPTDVPLGTVANKQGRIAGSNIVGENKTFKGVLASQVTKVFDLFIASTGLTPEQAIRAGYLVETSTVTKGDVASYYPGCKDNSLCLIFDKKRGQLLGAQGIGSKSIAGRINVLATAITAKMTIEQINELDLVYAPPVAPVYDPILIAASQALKKVEK